MLQKKLSFWDMLFGDPEPAGLRDKCEIVHYAEGLLTDADANMGTHFIAGRTASSNSDAAGWVRLLG